jgi:hypothetical protein
VFFNRLDEIRSRSFEQQRYRASGLNLTGDYLWRSSAKIGAGRSLDRFDCCHQLNVLYFPFSGDDPILH